MADSLPSDSPIVRSCLLLSTASYYTQQIEVERFLETCRHNFSSIFLHVTADDDDGSYIFAEQEDSVYLAIRGSFNKADWGTNFSAWPSITSAGTVHAGWYARSMKAPLGYLQWELNQGKSVYITGHSLGGAVATLITSQLLNSLQMCDPVMGSPLDRIHCVTFAAPLSMSSESARVHHAALGHKYTHFVYDGDIVPRIFTILQERMSGLNNTDLMAFLSLGRCLAKGAGAGVSDLPVLPVESIAKFLSTITRVITATVVGQYLPVGTYYLIRQSGAVDQILGNALMESLGQINVTTLPDILTSHAIRTTYWTHLRTHVQPFPSLSPSLRPFTPPPILLSSVELVVNHEVTVILRGQNLHCVSEVTTTAAPNVGGVVTDSDFGICHFGSRQTVDNFELNDGTTLMFSHLGLLGSPLTPRVNVLLKSIFHSQAVQTTVAPMLLHRHELDINSSHELLLLSFNLLLFADTHLANHIFAPLVERVFQIYKVVPLRCFLSPPSLILDYCVSVSLEKTARAILSHPLGECREAFVKYCTRANHNIKPFESANNSNFTNNFGLFDLLANAIEDSTDFSTLRGDLSPLQHIDNILSIPHRNLRISKEKLQDSRARGLTDSDRGRLIDVSRKSLGEVFAYFYFLVLPIKMFLDEKEGTITYNILRILQAALHQSSSHPLSSYLFVPHLFGIPLSVLFMMVSLMISALFIASPTLFKTHRARFVRESLWKKHHLTPVSGIKADEDYTVVQALSMSNITDIDSPEDLFRNLFQKDDDIAVLKLHLLAHQLRETLKSLPIVSIMGPTSSGKTALRELFSETPNFQDSGRNATRRTTFPSITPVSDDVLSFCVLDTVGEGTNADLQAIFSTINDMMKKSVNALVIITKFDCFLPEAEEYRALTSSFQLENGRLIPRAIPVRVPTITLFTYADSVTEEFSVKPHIVDSFNDHGEIERLENNRHFDMRSVHESPLYPRVWACIPDEKAYGRLRNDFPPDIRLPPPYDEKVLLPRHVKRWIVETLLEKKRRDSERR
jgi:hypothetical protein